MANKEILPKGDYKVKTVGPSRDWDFQGNNGTVKMATDSIQFEGHEQFWVDVNRAQDKPAPAVGETLNGHIEQDEAGKYPPKFKKASGGGGWGGNRGGGQASPGAIWSTAMSTAAQIVAGYYAASGTKPKDIKEYFGKVKALAPKVNAAVDELVAANKKEDTKPADTAGSESGESPAPASVPKADVVIEDISDEDLGDW